MLSLNPLYQKSILAANSPSGGYSRLKRVFVASQNYKQYEKIVSGAKNKILGNIPKEILDVILKTYPENKVEYIKKMQFILGQTAKILKEYEKNDPFFYSYEYNTQEEHLVNLKSIINKVIEDYKNDSKILQKKGIEAFNLVQKQNSFEIITTKYKELFSQLKK